MKEARLAVANLELGMRSLHRADLGAAVEGLMAAEFVAQVVDDHNLFYHQLGYRMIQWRAHEELLLVFLQQLQLREDRKRY